MEIFDFQVGDVFQYQYKEPPMRSGSGNGSQAVEILRKVRILSRQESGPMRAYRVHRLSRRLVNVNGNPQAPEVQSTYEDRVVQDTTGNPFSGCARDIVTMPEAQGDPAYFHTRVEVHSGDVTVFPLAGPGLRMKSYGRELGLWRGGDTILPVMDAFRREVYAEGLGLVSYVSGGGFAGATTETLLGWIKDGDATGMVYADSALYSAGTAIRLGSARGVAGAGGIRLARIGPRWLVEGVGASPIGMVNDLQGRRRSLPVPHHGRP